jgi:hypothetical protein
MLVYGDGEEKRERGKGGVLVPEGEVVVASISLVSKFHLRWLVEESGVAYR